MAASWLNWCNTTRGEIMASGDVLCGSVHRRALEKIVEKAAESMMWSRAPRAVGIDPTGRVYVGPVPSVPNEDMVGVYKYEGLIQLRDDIMRDLSYEVKTRGMTPHKSHRVIGNLVA